MPERAGRKAILWATKQRAQILGTRWFDFVVYFEAYPAFLK
jgi:hypothetical protein